MKRNIINFSGLYGENNSIVLPNFIQSEALQTRSKLYDWEINEHLHTDLYQVFVIESGSGILVSENKKFEIESPCVILIPSNTLHGFHFQPEIVGEVITFSDSFLENIFRNSPKILLEFNQLKQLSLENNFEIFQQIKLINNQITKELHEENTEKQIVLQALFQLLFISFYRISLSLKNDITQSDNRTLKYFQVFLKSIKKSQGKSITEYARELNITSVHLNRICQSLVQKSALQIVQDYLITEAKKYLLNTDYSISEVSYFLNFKDPAYFTRLFKKQTGVSPSEFRKN